MSSAKQNVRDGLIVGIIGYLAVALLYVVFDTLAARGTLYTVDLLGKTLFKGLRDTSVLGLPIVPDAAVIFWYNTVHLGIALVIGMVVTGLVAYAERHPERARLVTFIIVAGFVVTILVVGRLTVSIRRLLPWWSIVVANSLAVLMAGSYLLWRRPGTWARLSPFARN